MFTQFHQTATGYFKKQTVFTATSEKLVTVGGRTTSFHKTQPSP